MTYLLCLMFASLVFATAGSEAIRGNDAAAPAFRTVQDPQQAASERRDACLKCHGPFEKLRERTSKFVAPSGETLSPHRYVPHDSQESSSLPNCENCHKAHPLPPAPGDPAVLPKPKVDWCYEKCHHIKDFTPCKACHQER